MILNQNAPAAKAEKAGDSSHWYGHTPEAGWHPLYTPDKNFTLRQARVVQAEGGIAVPSVTTYLSDIDKKPVIDWKMEQVAKACRHMALQSLPEVIDRYSEQEWCEMAIGTASRASHPARDLGTAIHAAIELAVAGKDYDAAMDVYVQPVLAERAKWSLVSIAQEKCVGNAEMGYAGKVDDLCEGMIVSDYKSRGKANAYPTDWVQAAAYGYAEWGNSFFLSGAAIIFPIGTKEPGLVKSVMKPGKELLQAFDAFCGLMQSWRYFHKYDPRKPVAGCGTLE